ncbi:hypothetical protein SSS_09691 [Sarcoptes scabiei]|uniref:Uncharacterized protein n=1 Tax=Sarcoptes scabiei TaxID=52283 RepID=A0A834REK1_SARSC|nr:hypothetical protein SSS_09691 [Sarcoptes scabiei]
MKIAMKNFLHKLLITIIIVFYCYTLLELITVKQFFIKRLIELHQERRELDSIVIESKRSSKKEKFVEQNSNNTKISNTNSIFIDNDDQNQSDQELDLNRIRNKQDQQIIDGLSFDSFRLNQSISTDNTTTITTSPNSVHSKTISFVVIVTIIIIETIYCFLYIFIVKQSRFWPVICFGLLSLLSLLQRLIQPFADDDAVLNFHDDLIALISLTDAVEIFISILETSLVFSYALLLKGDNNNRRYQSRLVTISTRNDPIEESGQEMRTLSNELMFGLSNLEMIEENNQQSNLRQQMAFTDGSDERDNLMALSEPDTILIRSKRTILNRCKQGVNYLFGIPKQFCLNY